MILLHQFTHCATAVVVLGLYSMGEAAGMVVPDWSANVSIKVPAGHHKWAGGILGADGRVYCMPHDAHSVLVIDPVAGTVDYTSPQWQVRRNPPNHTHVLEPPLVHTCSVHNADCRP